MKIKAADHIIFHHIPKTAGTTLYSIIDNSFSGKVYTINGNQTEHDDSKKEFSGLPQNVIDSIDLLKGHRTYGMDRLFSGTVKYLTILRKPAQRHISGYYQILKVKPELKERIEFVKSPPSLEEYVRMGDIYYGKNPQLKTFLNIPDPTVEVNDEMLTVALKIIKDQYFHVGLTEEFDRTCIILNQYEGFNIEKYLKRNVANNYDRTQISDDLINLYNKIHSYDVIFYDEVRKIFEGEWDKVINGEELVDKFQKKNRKWNRQFLLKENIKRVVKKIIRR